MITFHLYYAGIDGIKVVLNSRQQEATWNTLKCVPAFYIELKIKCTFSWNEPLVKVLFSQSNLNLFHHSNSQDLRSYRTCYHYGETRVGLKSSYI
jgi:hypothetical protein